jgi:hypothetical protein
VGSRRTDKALSAWRGAASQGLKEANAQLRTELDSSRAATHAELERLRDRLSAAEAKAAAEAEAEAAAVRAMHKQTSKHLQMQQQMGVEKKRLCEVLATAVREKEEGQAELVVLWLRYGEAEDQLECVQTERTAAATEYAAAVEEEKRKFQQCASEVEKMRKKLDVRVTPGVRPA